MGLVTLPRRSWTISPGPGTDGSLRWRFMWTCERRRLLLEEVVTWRERELEEPEAEEQCQQEQNATMRGSDCANARREPSCCRPALTAAAAWREVEADRLGEGEGREGEGGSPPSLLVV